MLENVEENVRANKENARLTQELRQIMTDISCKFYYRPSFLDKISKLLKNFISISGLLSQLLGKQNMNVRTIYW